MGAAVQELLTGGSVGTGVAVTAFPSVRAMGGRRSLR